MYGARPAWGAPADIPAVVHYRHAHALQTAPQLHQAQQGTLLTTAEADFLVRNLEEETVVRIAMGNRQTSDAEVAAQARDIIRYLSSSFAHPERREAVIYHIWEGFLRDMAAIVTKLSLALMIPLLRQLDLPLRKTRQQSMDLLLTEWTKMSRRFIDARCLNISTEKEWGDLIGLGSKIKEAEKEHKQRRAKACMAQRARKRLRGEHGRWVSTKEAAALPKETSEAAEGTETAAADGCTKKQRADKRQAADSATAATAHTSETCEADREGFPFDGGAPVAENKSTGKKEGGGNGTQKAVHVEHNNGATPGGAGDDPAVREDVREA